MITIDGSYGEGGGQILRTSVSLAAHLGVPVEIANIRAKRTKPGLQPQHWTAVRAAAEICHAELEGVEVNSVWLRFTPRKPVAGGNYRFNISEMIGKGSAGATPLIFQTLFVPLLFAPGPTQLVVEGGTHVPHSPSADYLQHVYLPALQQAGAQVKFQTEAAGFYPRGGGRVVAQIIPSKLSGLHFSERGKLTALKPIVTTAELPDHVAERGMEKLLHLLKGRGVNPQPLINRVPSQGAGAAATLAVSTKNGIAGFSALGERGKPMEQVSEGAYRDFERWLSASAAVDEHLADQLVLPMVLAQGSSYWTTPEVTQHLLTVVWVIKHFLDREITVEGAEGEAGSVRI